MSLTADSRRKKTTITMKVSIKLAFTIIFYFSFCISTSLLQGNICPTYVDIPGSQPKTSSTAPPSSDCRSACFSNTSCNGFSQSSGSCLLNTGNPNDINYNATTATSYSVILRTSCSAGQNCTWTSSKFIHGQGGNRNSMTTINTCLMSCQTDSKCTGLDWDANANSCWIFNTSGFATAPSAVVHHFDKTCSNVSTTGSTGTSRSTAAASSITSSVAIQPTQSPSVPSVSTVTAPSCKTPCRGGSVCGAGGLCVCNSVCTLEDAPVCGSDNVTYGNECLFNMNTCQKSANTTIRSRDVCGAVPNWNPMAIKPAYIVIAGIGGGCLLLVLTAVIILCEYSMNDETFTHGVVKQPIAKQQQQQQQQCQAEEIDIAVVDGDNVEFNPYYNRSEIDAPDFTKEENLM